MYVYNIYLRGHTLWSSSTSDIA